MGSSGEVECDFRFNDSEFSDRVLRLEITPALSEVSNTSEFGATGLKTKTIHINSLMLAYKSQFFYKLFKNGRRETKQRDEVVLRINESEEAAFMDLMKFIYDQSLNASSAQDLVIVLMAADKFEIPSCVKYCVDLLLKLPMTTELALVYLELPSSVLSDEVAQTLIESAKSYICAHYRDFTNRRSQEEAMSLPLCAVELLIGSDSLEVDSEDDVFDFILEWGRFHYPELEERREILTGLLVKFICLPNMSRLKLKEVINCSDLDSEKMYKPVLDALLAKDQDLPTTKINHDYPRRVYNDRARGVQVVQLQLASPRCLVYFDLEIFRLSLFQDLVSSEYFCLGGLSLRLHAKVWPTGDFTLGLNSPGICTILVDTSVMKKSSMEFTSLVQKTTAVVMVRNILVMPLKELLSEEGNYLIDGILHFRVDITLISIESPNCFPSSSLKGFKGR